jgi:hypothetical protein
MPLEIPMFRATVAREIGSFRKSHCLATGRCMKSPAKVMRPNLRLAVLARAVITVTVPVRGVLVMGVRFFRVPAVKPFVRAVCRGRPPHCRLAQRQKQERRRHQTREFHDLSLPHFLFNRAISMRSPTCVPVRNTVCAGSSSTLVAFSDTAEIRNGRKCSST